MNFAEVRLSSSHFRPQCAEDVQCAELAFTSSVTSLPSVPGVRGSQPEDFWKVLPLQRHDAPGSCEKDYSK